MKPVLCFLFLLFSVCGCFQAYHGEDDLRTVPVTNNPHIVPETARGFPGTGFPN